MMAVSRFVKMIVIFEFINATDSPRQNSIRIIRIVCSVYLSFMVKSAYEPKWLIRPELILVSVALSD